ncbi:non-ribosomal peptide synthetase, partial [Paenibacillus albidus]|uniref:non-ribosomal peptide synthetase n=1 Tax=Paenibacillus albidus TaxID=2041023 RepID=UPI001669852C
VARVSYLLEDSQAQVLLAKAANLGKVDIQVETIELERAADMAQEPANLAPINTSSDLVYMMYTSGSTGKPKGVMVEHRNVVRLVRNTSYMMFEEGDRILQTGAQVFDPSTFEIWGALLNGLELYVIDKYTLLDPNQLEKMIQDNRITIMQLTTPLFNQIARDKSQMFSGLKRLMVGGDVLSAKRVAEVKKACPGLKIVNAYGPTENTVISSYYLVDKELQETSIPIGRPIQNSTTYIVDRYGKLAPIGVPGELWVGGDGVARGYKNLDELTAEKFIADPFQEGGRMYLTGDMAKWQPGGNLEFIGRVDNQLKIRGFRVETGEVERQISSHDFVDEAVVIAKEHQDGHKYLCAYVVSKNDLTVQEMREYLAERLPEYLHPTGYVFMDELPLNQNGKINRKALPEPAETLDRNREIVAPKNEMEKKLVEVWMEVLGVATIGTEHNFFELGGDSIKAIQVTSKLNSLGYSLSVRNLLLNPEISKLNKFIEEGDKELDQGIIQSVVALAPVQKWFFESDFTDMNHWNQAVMLYRQDRFDVDILRQVFTELVEHHDALRMVYRHKDEKIEQYNRGLEGSLFDLSVEEIPDSLSADITLANSVRRIQTSIDLQHGPLMKLGLFRMSDGDHLLIVIHHLVIDGVSWRILFEDLTTGYRQLLKKQPIQLPKKTNSYKDWVSGIEKYAIQKGMRKEQEYWAKIESSVVKPLPKDAYVSERKVKDNASYKFNLSMGETIDLMTRAHAAYNTDMNDLLLCALGMAVKKWTKEDRILIHTEGHGREEILGHINISRTVGWFTSFYPVVLEMEYTDDLSYQIKHLKESLRQIPNKGVGNSILKYMALSENRDRSNLTAQAEIGFNYLGQFDTDVNTDLFEISKLSSGQEISPNSERHIPLDITGMIENSMLTISITYNAKEFNEQTIKQFGSYFKESLQEIIQFSVAKQTKELTPSDVGGNDLTLEDFEAISSFYGL